MPLVIAAEDLRVESPPAFMFVVRRVSAKRMARGADADEWFACLQMLTDEGHHFLGRRAAADADEQQVGVSNDREIGKYVVPFLGSGGYERAFDSARLEFLGGELRQGLPGMILVFADDKNDMRGFVGL